MGGDCPYCRMESFFINTGRNLQKLTTRKAFLALKEKKAMNCRKMTDLND
jgi:hypothetical protein